MQGTYYTEYTNKVIDTNKLILAIMKGLGFKKQKTLYTYFYNNQVIGSSFYNEMLEKDKKKEKLADNDTIKMLKTLLALALGIPKIDNIVYDYIENIAFDMGLTENQIRECLNKSLVYGDLSGFDEIAKFPELNISSELTKRHYSILSKLNHYFLKIIPTDDLFGMSVMGKCISGTKIKNEYYSKMAGDFSKCMYMFYTKLLDLCVNKRADKPTIKPTIKLEKAAKIFLEDLLLQNYYDRVYLLLTKSDPISNNTCSLPRGLAKKRLNKSNIAPYDFIENSHKDITSSQAYIIPLYQALTMAACKFVESEELYSRATDKHEESVLAKKLSENKKQLDSLINKAVGTALEQDQIKLNPKIVHLIALSAAKINYNHMVYKNFGQDYLPMYYPIQIVEEHNFRFTRINTLKDFKKYYNETLNDTAYIYNMYKAKVDEYEKLKHENEMLKEKLSQFESNNN